MAIGELEQGLSVNVRDALEDLKPTSVLLFILLFAILALCGFLANWNLLFYGLDGASWDITMGYQGLFRSAWSPQAADPMQGMFDAYFPAYNEYYPWWWWRALFGRTSIDRALIYVLYALLLLWSVYLSARLLKIERAKALLAGAALPILCMPMFSVGLLYPIMSLNPHVAYLIFISLLIGPCVWLAGRGPAWACLSGIMIAALVVVAAGAMLPHVVLMVLPVGFFSLAAIAARQNSRERFCQLGACLLALALIVASGIPYKLYVISQYTVPGFFSDELLQVRREWSYISILYHDSLGLLLVVSGCLGALASAFSQDRLRRAFAIAFLASFAVLQLGGVAFLLFGEGYQGPSPLYFEFFVWPYYVLFGVSLWWRCLRVAWDILARGRLRRLMPAKGVYGCLLLALAIKTLITPALVGAAPPGNFSPLGPTSITDRLHDALALDPNMDFRGYAATFTAGGDAPTDWFQLHYFDWRLWQASANDLRTIGLWRFSIPTLFHYSTLMTPQFYVMLTEFLSRPTDRQLRSAIVFTHPDERMLRLWGVRFLISDRDLPFGREAMRQTVDGVATLRLYELLDSNLGQYAPKRVIPVVDFRMGIDIMRRSDFDAREVAVISATSLPQGLAETDLAPAADVTLTVERDTLRLRAASAGKTLLVLPAQYSHCWVASDPAASLLRVDMLQLGVLFDRAVDIELRLAVPVFGNPVCRTEDLRDMTRLKIRDARHHYHQEATDAIPH